MKPLIIITGAHRLASDGVSDGLVENQLFQNYADAVTAAGGLPLLALYADEGDAARLARQADGLLLSGGMDVHPGCYGEEKLPACGATDEQRDHLELLLGRTFLQERKPIWGICRGVQMLNVLLGGSLYQDIPSQLGLAHPYNSVHAVSAVPGGPIEQLFGGEFQVNSLHHQALKRLGQGLVPLAFSEAGAIVEAVAHQEWPLIGTQWHPERMTGVNRWSKQGPEMLPLFEHFISLCVKL